ncbi:hypothetical protein LIER_13506 [Lithospermum erythrorhizon]|uniref:Uncharacterized protein n=1 Tax=Lithospermum erythrorhizon TaxID=34254 RepID=A0AAV3Q098_LITER
MDEVVPSVECMSPPLSKKDHVSKSCRFLLHANHCLVTSSSDRSISPVEWINFWSALPRGYVGPSTAESGRAGSSSLPCYPCGSIPAHGSGGSANLRVFKSLEVPSSLVDERVPYWAAIRPLLPSPQVFTDDQLDSEEDMAFFLSLRTNMVGYREDAFFRLEAYNPHCFSKQLGFSPSIPGFKSRSLRFALLGPVEGKSAPCLSSSVVFASSKPLKKRSLTEDDQVDKNPKHANWGTTRRPGPVDVSYSDVPGTVTKHAEIAILADAVLSSGDEDRTEIVDSDESSDCMVIEVADSKNEAHVKIVDSAGPLDRMITETAVPGSQGNGAQTEVVDVGEPLNCVIMKAAVAAVPAASSFTGVQRIETIL